MLILRLTESKPPVSIPLILGHGDDSTTRGARERAVKVPDEKLSPCVAIHVYAIGRINPLSSGFVEIQSRYFVN